jgi:voltage-gated potassium channel
MSRRQTYFEWFIQLTILVGLVVHLVDLHVVQDREEGVLHSWLRAIDVIIILIFTIEYLVRWYWAPNRWRYPFGFMAIIDLLVILPFYVSHFLDLRSLRLIRFARVLQLLKIYRYNKAMQSFLATIRKVVPQLEVIGIVLLIVVVISSTAMFEAERDAQPDKIRHMGDSIWWCVVTLATVGYGDITPVTPLGRWIAGITMVVGLGIFGTFISLIGSAFITAMQDEEHHSLTLSKPVYRQLKACLKACDEPMDLEHLRHYADQAVVDFVARRRQSDLRE